MSRFSVLLASSWVNMALYTFELVLCSQYFRRLARPAAHKIGVGVLVFFDSVCTLAVALDICVSVAAPGVTNPRLLLAPLATQVFATYVSSVVSQLFLTNLLYTLTSTKSVAWALLILIFVHLGFSWASAFAILATGNERGIAFTFSIVGAISCAVTDIIIGASLAWKFWTMMDRTIPVQSTRSLLREIMILTITSGTLCAGNTLVIMVLLLKNSAAVNFFFVCQGRVYALTLLGNFLVGLPGRSARAIRGRLELDVPLGTSVALSSHAIVFRNPVSTVGGMMREDDDDESSGPSEDTSKNTTPPDRDERRRLRDPRFPPPDSKADSTPAPNPAL
ncbi:hypothetical protein B0H11DRAFT_1285633 [Mycena galericulata]|nr:hypothetical protein B0H11DRAFT_1285633 [Mycena galericulata]